MMRYGSSTTDMAKRAILYQVTRDELTTYWTVSKVTSEYARPIADYSTRTLARSVARVLNNAEASEVAKGA